MKLKPAFHAFRKFTLLLLFAFPLSVSGQWLNRFDLHLSSGYHKAVAYGINVYFKNHFVAGIATDLFYRKTGPVYMDRGSLGIFSHPRQLSNGYKGLQFLAGITTHRMAKVDFDLLIGITRVNASEYTDFEKKYSEYAHSEYMSAKLTTTGFYGFVTRANMNLEVSSAFGFHLSVEQQWNKLQPNFSIQAGIDIGIIQDLHLIRNRSNSIKKRTSTR